MTLPASAPELVILNIDPAAGRRLDAVLSSLPQVVRWTRVPFLHARITALNGRKVAELHVPADVAYVVRSDRGVSWLTAPPGDDGSPPGNGGRRITTASSPASLDTGCDTLGLDIGDTLTLSVLGSASQARVTNLRRVDRAALDLDFPTCCRPSRPRRRTGRSPPCGPHHPPVPMATDLRGKISQAFPEAPVVVVSEITAFLVKSADRLGRALGGLAAATGLAAFLAPHGYGCRQPTPMPSRGNSAETVGATRRQTLGANGIEFTIIALVAAVAALVLGNLRVGGRRRPDRLCPRYR